MNWNLSLSKNINTLLLVAHPDDETIFCGGTMLCYPKWAWTVVSMTEDGRPNEFQNAMEAFKNLGVNIVSYKMLGQENVDQGAKLPDLVEEKVIWEKVVREQNLSPDITLTHNEVGEYGHGAHILLSAVADDLFSNVWNFIYPKGQQPYKEKSTGFN